VKEKKGFFVLFFNLKKGVGNLHGAQKDMSFCVYFMHGYEAFEGIHGIKSKNNQKRKNLSGLG
jgi:hypothetical protein